MESTLFEVEHDWPVTVLVELVGFLYLVRAAGRELGKKGIFSSEIVRRVISVLSHNRKGWRTMLLPEAGKSYR